MSHDAEMDAAMARIGVLRYRLEQADAENARLKAEVERLQSIHSIGLEQLKAQVERLSKKEDYLHDLLNQYALDDMRLQAKVERLTKAGDAMLSEWSNGDEKDAKNFLKALAIWHTAKGGKQS